MPIRIVAPRGLYVRELPESTVESVVITPSTNSGSVHGQGGYLIIGA